VRANANDKVFGVFNLSARPVKVRFRQDLHQGQYRDFDTGEPVRIDADSQLAMAPWSYRVLVR
jgi:hypothetical protein